MKSTVEFIERIKKETGASTVSIVHDEFSEHRLPKTDEGYEYEEPILYVEMEWTNKKIGEISCIRHCFSLSEIEHLDSERLFETLIAHLKREKIL